ncbi:helix-turn-helix domain-containing protein [Paenibacillus sp. 1001270B_150601_E10]|uniref:helix-turn-helix domain-containing protein n=1 Tax=Paenibacillus sp. 1001270B_150601_E10 TaxID=2787079 RepID=UPI00189C9348|nr:helix-turn-helix transcriptional regulator [Paenibacillus sp. 1001270B_150601_E10]
MNTELVFGKVLKAVRTKYDISQEELAFRSNLDRTYISMLERGIHQPSLSSLMSIAQAVNIKASDLVRLYEIELEKHTRNINHINEDRP